MTEVIIMVPWLKVAMGSRTGRWAEKMSFDRGSQSPVLKCFLYVWIRMFGMQGKLADRE